MTMIRAQLRLAAIVAFASGLSCAYVPRVLRLEQPENAPTPIGSRPCINVDSFGDVRPDRTTVGVARNGLYWPTASARTSDDVPQWVASHFRNAFPCRDRDGCAGEFLLKGAVRDVFVDEYVNLDGFLVVSLRLERSGVMVFERDFEGRHSQLSQLGSNSEFEETLRQTLKDLGNSAIPAIVDAAAADLNLR
jgi:hypothetical protein